MFKRAGLIGLSLLACAGLTRAADIAPGPEAYDWSGFYIGASAGYGWGEADFDGDATGLWEGTRSEPLVDDALDIDADPEGVLGGLKLGWMFQHGAWVFGVEADISYVDADADGGPVSNDAIALSRSEAGLSWLGTARARAGFAADRALFYATGGLAAGDWHVETLLDAGQTGTARFDEKEWKLGWVAGGGVEYAVSDAWSINAEYLYMDFGSIDGDSAFDLTPVFTQDHAVDLTAQVVRAGVSFRFR